MESRKIPASEIRPGDVYYYTDTTPVRITYLDGMNDEPGAKRHRFYYVWAFDLITSEVIKESLRKDDANPHHFRMENGEPERSFMKAPHSKIEIFRESWDVDPTPPTVHRSSGS